MTRVALGLGCDRGASLATLQEALRLALRAAGVGVDAVVQAATIDRKQDEPAILSLARHQGWSLRFYSAEALSRVQVPNPSETVRRHMGTPTVAEAAALLAAGTDASDLLVEKYRFRGRDGKNATVSIARMGGDE